MLKQLILMRKLFLTSGLIVTVLLGGQLLLSDKALAQDVWAYTDTYDNYQAYVDTDSIRWNRDRTDLSVNVKEVRNNRLLYTEIWYFGYVGGEWRYETESMRRAARARGIGWHDNRVFGSSERILKICQNY